MLTRLTKFSKSEQHEIVEEALALSKRHTYVDIVSALVVVMDDRDPTES